MIILWISLKTLGEFQPKNYKISRSLAEDYKSRQNTDNPNISRIFGSAGFIFLIQPGSLHRQLSLSLALSLFFV